MEALVLEKAAEQGALMGYAPSECILESELPSGTWDSIRRLKLPSGIVLCETWLEYVGNSVVQFRAKVHPSILLTEKELADA